jgi:DNA-binding GntR family transcriptional regulator
MSHSVSDNAAPNLLPLQQPQSLKDKAYEALHKAILAGDLQQGTIYREKDLAEMLSISRTPVREALLELSTKDLVTFLPRKGIKINSFQAKDWNEIFEFRKALEMAIVEKVTATASRQDIQQMQGLIRSQQECMRSLDSLRFLDFDRQLHMLLCKLTHNSRIISSYAQILDLIQLMGTYALTAKGRMQQVLQEHQAVVDSLTQGEVHLAQKHMVQHIEISRDLALQRLFGSAGSQPEGASILLA